MLLIDLELGELLHDEMFGLFEAMSAIEMMDPKMDAGMLCNRGARRAKSFDQAVDVSVEEKFFPIVFFPRRVFQDGSLKLLDFSYDELIGIMDTTLACIVSWLEGHSLAQTVFTNLYLHKPYQIEDKALRYFCLMVYKLLEVIKDYIHKYVF